MAAVPAGMGRLVVTVRVCEPASGQVSGFRLGDDLGSDSLSGTPSGCRPAGNREVIVRTTGTTPDGLPFSIATPTGSNGLATLTAPVGGVPMRIAVSTTIAGQPFAARAALWPGQTTNVSLIVPANPNALAAAGSVNEPPGVTLTRSWVLALALLLTLAIAAWIGAGRRPTRMVRVRPGRETPRPR